MIHKHSWSRAFRFERISALLEKRVHETIFEINLTALVHNLNVYRSRLNPNVKLMGMVKAFSYGAGSYEIAKVLEFHRVDYLTVAYADEGVELRKSGIKLPICGLSAANCMSTTWSPKCIIFLSSIN